MAKTLIRFDWAMKRLLRQKSNFDILEGFLSELLREDIRIEQILESESNQDEAALKFNRVDLLALNSKGQLIIIELQNDSETDYFYRIGRPLPLFGTAKAVTEYLALGDAYSHIKKVYSINIVYFNLGQGTDYVYHGMTEFRGIHQDDVLRLSANQKKVFGIDEVFEIYPEYYLIKVNNFDNLAKDTLDEWIYYLKNNEVKPGSQAKGLGEVQRKLEFDELNPDERAAYLKSLENKVIDRDVMQTKYDEGLEKGEQIGIDKARTEAAEATRQGIVRALQRGKLTVDEIAEDFGVSVAEVLAIRQTMA
jgi:predicted transposase/invertase (TIGR01784 family)